MIGLETHVELGTATKMFCGCPTAFGGEPNTFVCPVCLGLPGSLPVANRAAIEYTIRIGLALNCTIADWCRFARKNYFYPDMPKNFQISQYDEPLCVDGWLDIAVDEPGGGARQVRVGIERVHLEEDTGKSLHVGGATGRIHGADYSLVDYNRAGIPLVEIVTKPIAGTGALAPDVARAYVTELRDLMRALGVSDVRMEEGSLRCDVNTSLSPRGSAAVGDPDRDQERQLAALGGAGGAVRDRAAGRGARRRSSGSCRRPGTSTRTPGPPRRGAARRRRRTTGTSPSRTWCRSPRPGNGWSRSAPTLPELPAAWRARLHGRLGPVRPRHGGAAQRWRGRPGRADGGRRGLARQTRANGGSGELARRANESGTDLADLPITPARCGAGVRRWWRPVRSTTSWPGR